MFGKWPRLTRLLPGELPGLEIAGHERMGRQRLEAELVSMN
jgi:hypothetical protein